MFQENYKLTPDDIAEFNRTGSNLDDKKTYIIKFLFNDKWNDATDPRPYRIKTSLVQKLANDAVGMPFVVNPDPKFHLRGTNEGKPDTAKALLEIQAKYAIGVIRIPIIKPNNNVYGIIEVFPDYEEDIPNLPPFTSPTVLPIKEDADGIDDAQFLNINAVETPGYPQVLAGITGMCKNGIKECIAELAPLGAAGTLKQSRENSKTFLNNLQSLKKNMSMSTDTTKQPPTSDQPSLSEIKTAIESVQTDVTSVKDTGEKIKSNVENNNQVLKDVATKTPGVDETKVVEKVDETPSTAPDTSTAPANPDKPIGAAGSQRLQIPADLKDNQFVQGLVQEIKDAKKELDGIKLDAEARKAKEAESLRLKQATSIVEKLILLKQVKAEDKDKEIKKYVELKGSDDKLENLTVLDNYLKSSIPNDDEETSPLGAGGYRYPGISGDKTPSTMTNAEAMGYDA